MDLNYQFQKNKGSYNKIQSRNYHVFCRNFNKNNDNDDFPQAPGVPAPLVAGAPRAQDNLIESFSDKDLNKQNAWLHSRGG